jgi:N-acetylglucosamine-6-phosphate deacetylase
MIDTGLRFRPAVRRQAARAGPAIAASLALVMAIACGPARAAAPDPETPDYLVPDGPPLSARDPGIIGAALAERRLTAGLIVDGIHVDPVSVRAAFAAKGFDRIALVTDAMPTVGTSLDRFELIGRTITLADGRLSTDTGTLAGAHLDMATAVRNAVTLAQLPLEDALRAASLTPAQFLGLEHERGALFPGARADLVALTDDLRVVATWLGGNSDDVESDQMREV